MRAPSVVLAGVLVVASLGSGELASAKVPGENGRVSFGTEDGVIYTARADGSARTLIETDDPTFWPRWSPDGSRLLTATFSEFGLRPATMKPNGSHRSVLKVPSLPSYMDIGPCVWVPSGTRILCKAQNYNTPNHSLDGVYSMTPDGSKVRRLTVNPFPPADPFGGGDSVGDVSPDGRRYVFTRARPLSRPDRDQSGALFVQNTDGTGLHRITKYGLPNSHDEGVESWSPDGSRILFGSEHGRLFMIRPDGSDLTRLRIRGAGAFRFASVPVWSPDGSRIITRLFRQTVGRFDIYTMRADGTKLHRLTTEQLGDVTTPDWGPRR